MEYKYYQDRKTTIWERDHFIVEADTQEDADREAKIQFITDTIEQEEGETLWDTSEYMNVEENNGFAVKQLYRSKDDELLIDDEDIELKRTNLGYCQCMPSD
jgi:hypothetical protein